MLLVISFVEPFVCANTSTSFPADHVTRVIDREWGLHQSVERTLDGSRYHQSIMEGNPVPSVERCHISDWWYKEQASERLLELQWPRGWFKTPNISLPARFSGVVALVFGSGQSCGLERGDLSYNSSHAFERR